MKELDEVTIRRAASGTMAAFRHVYDYYSPFVWRVVYRLVNGDTAAAEQIMQDVFVKIHSTMSRFRYNSAFSTWLYRITYNEAMAYLNGRSKNARRLVPYNDHSVHVDATDDQCEHRDTVGTLLKTLTPQERFLLIAREVNDIPFEDLAAITGKTTGALRTMLHRLKENLRKGFDYETGRVLSHVV
jgi:RNA polymerase sigma-70 factor (ECF subfamily)